MQEILQHRHLPDTDRLSLLSATILLAYALARFVDLPIRELAVQLPGLYLSLGINLRTLVTFLVAGVTASGADWLLRAHPRLGEKSTIEHWLLPTLTAWVIGLPLFQLPLGLTWWGGFAIGGSLLMLVLVAEYITVDPEDMRHPIAAAGLTAVSFALFLSLVVALRYSGTRLVLFLPGMALACALVSLRTLHLRLHGRWAFLQAGLTALVCAQLAAPLHYWPLSPVSMGLALLGPAYALTSLMANLGENKPMHQALVEPLVVLVIVWGCAVWVK